MKKILYSLILLLPLLARISYAQPEEQAEPSEPQNPVFVIPIEGQIENGLVYVIRRGILEADRKNAQAIVLDMHTPGGAVNSTEEICSILKSTDIPLLTFVDGNGISAGAIIALTTHSIYMTPGSKIGDAMPIAMGQQLGENEREKIESYVDGLVRSNCEFSGRDTDIGTAMVRRTFEYKIGDDVISPEGQILTLTNLEAEKQYGDPPTPLLSKGTVDSLEEALKREGFEHAPIVRLEPTGLEQLARIIAALAPILMMIGMASIYLEIQSPGIGIPAIVAGICLSLFFFGHHIAGLAGMEEVLLLFLGVALILVELFVLPGFGIAGFLGIGLILTSFLTSMVESLPNDPIIPDWETLQGPVLNVAMGLGGSTILILLAMRYLPGRGPLRGLVLQEALTYDLGDAEEASTYNSPVSAGDEGKAITDLHPSGTATFGPHRLDVVSPGEYIEKSKPIRVTEIHGSRIVVEEIKGTSA